MEGNTPNSCGFWGNLPRNIMFKINLIVFGWLVPKIFAVKTASSPSQMEITGGIALNTKFSNLNV